MALPRLYSVPGVRYLRRDTPDATPKSRYYSDFRDPRDTTKDPRGKKRRIFLGRSLKVAQAKLLEMLREAQVADVGPPAGSGPYTLGEAQERCLADLVAGGLGDATRKRYRSSDGNALRAFGPPLYIHQIRRVDVKAWFADRARETSPTTANRDLGRLAQVLDWAIEAGWLADGNPARKIRHFHEVSHSEPFTDAEWSRILASAAEDPELLDMVIFAGETGMRQGEQLHLSWSENIRGGHIWLKSRESRKRVGNQTKSKKGRLIPITSVVAEILARQRERHPEGDLVFPNTKGRPWHRGNFRKYRWKTLFDRAGLERATWHKFRHDFCSRLRQGGVDLVDIADLAGHANLAVTRRYAKHYTGHLEAKMEARVRPNFGSGTPGRDTQGEES